MDSVIHPSKNCGLLFSNNSTLAWWQDKINSISQKFLCWSCLCLLALHYDLKIYPRFATGKKHPPGFSHLRKHSCSVTPHIQEITCTKCKKCSFEEVISWSKDWGDVSVPSLLIFYMYCSYTTPATCLLYLLGAMFYQTSSISVPLHHNIWSKFTPTQLSRGISN